MMPLDIQARARKVNSAFMVHGYSGFGKQATLEIDQCEQLGRANKWWRLFISLRI